VLYFQLVTFRKFVCPNIFRECYYLRTVFFAP
jgi:hypothetical protein